MLLHSLMDSPNSRLTLYSFKWHSLLAADEEGDQDLDHLLPLLLHLLRSSIGIHREGGCKLV